MDRKEQNKVLVDTIDESEIKHPINAVECNGFMEKNYPITCDKCSDKHICMWEH